MADPNLTRTLAGLRQTTLRIGIAILVPTWVFQAAAEPVDLELLLAVDVSPSVSKAEYELQMGGLSNAFRHPSVVNAIIHGAPNGIAVALMQWSGPGDQAVAVDWTAVHDRPTAFAFADRVDRASRLASSGGTAIGNALDRGIALLAANGFTGSRRVIDISGDGRANRGASPGPMRHRAVYSGITVNGLTILDEEPELNLYYLDYVIGGPGSFLLVADDFDAFAQAIRMKLLMEIGGATIADASSVKGRLAILGN